MKAKQSYPRPDDAPLHLPETRDSGESNLAESCSCAECVSLCTRNPGWMTPQEAMQAIADGHSSRLMRDWLEPSDRLGNKERIFVLAAASFGCEGQDAPEFAYWQLMIGGNIKGQCTFLQGGKCELHETGYKPKQCRESMGCRAPLGPDNYEMARLWDTEEGRRALDFWFCALLMSARRRE